MINVVFQIHVAKGAFFSAAAAAASVVLKLAIFEEAAEVDDGGFLRVQAARDTECPMAKRVKRSDHFIELWTSKKKVRNDSSGDQRKKEKGGLGS